MVDIIIIDQEGDVVVVGIVLLTRKCLSLMISQLFRISKKCASHFCRETANENKLLNERKNMASDFYLIRLSFNNNTDPKIGFPLFTDLPLNRFKLEAYTVVS